MGKLLIELYRHLWKRGAFNRDTNILEDSGLDQDNHLLLVDFTDVVFSLEEANEYLIANREFISRFHFRLFAEMTSPETLQYYIDSMRRLYEDFLSPEWQVLWGTETAQAVEAPRSALQAREYSANSPLGRALNMWNFILNNIVRRYETGVTTYIPLSQDEIPAAILERELNEGSPSQRSMAEEIIMLIGFRIGEDLLSMGVDDVQYDILEVLERLPRNTHKVADKIISISLVAKHPERWEKSKMMLLLQQAVNKGSKGRISLELPYREKKLAVASEVFIARDGENAFENTSLPLISPETSQTLAARLKYEPFVAYSLTSGKGLRSGLLSVQDSKANIRIFNRRLVDYSRDLIPASSFSGQGVNDAAENWLVLTVGDNFFLKNDMKNSLIQQLEKESSRGASIVYFDMLNSERMYGSFVIWLISQFLDVMEYASRFGPFLNRLVSHIGTKMYLERLVHRSGGVDLPGAIFLKPSVAEPVLDILRELRANLSGTVELHRYLILPFKVSFSQWRLLWNPDHGISKQNWDTHWQKMQDIKKEARPVGIVYNGIHVNANRTRDIYNFYQGTVDKDSPGRLEEIRKAAKLPQNQNLIDSEIKGDIVFIGSHLVFNSKLSSSPGVRIIVENNVVIDNSDIEFTGLAGEYIIPSGTVIAHSHYRGGLESNGTGAFWYKVNVSDGQAVPLLTDTVHSTIFLSDGRRLTGSLPMNFDPKQIDPKTGHLYLDTPLDEFNGMSLDELRTKAKFWEIELASSDGLTVSSEPTSSRKGSIMEKSDDHEKIVKPEYLQNLALLARYIFIITGIAFIYFLTNHFLIPQFNNSVLDAAAGTDYIVYYIGPLVGKALGSMGTVFDLNDFRTVISQGLVNIDHPNQEYYNWAIRSAEGFISTPFTFLLFKQSLSLMPFWLSLNMWVAASISILVITSLWSTGQAVKASGTSYKSISYWKMLSVSFLVFAFAPSLVSIGLGQINSIVLLLTAISLFTYLELYKYNRRPQFLLWVIGPLSLALAIGIKIMPVFVPAFMTVRGLWNLIKPEPSSEKELSKYTNTNLLRLLWGEKGIRYVILTSIWLAVIIAGTIVTLGFQFCIDWVSIALPRALDSAPVIAPADVPDLSTYLTFLHRGGIITQGISHVIKLALSGLFVFLAVKASRIKIPSAPEDNKSVYLHTWLTFSFWSLAMFTWTFMRCHYLIFSILIIPPLIVAAMQIKSNSYRTLIFTLITLSFIGFSHPIPFFMIHGGITNYVAPYSLPVNLYNIILGYPATLSLAGAVWMALAGLNIMPTKEPLTNVDFHIHSTYDYGELTPAQIVEKGLQRGMTAMAITDQHMFSGVEEALERAKGTNLEIIPATELRTSYGKRRRDILVYFPDVELFIGQKDEIENTIPTAGSDVKDVIAWARRFNGVTVYAHPGLFPGEDVTDEIIYELFELGLDGIEVDRVFLSLTMSKKVFELVKKWNSEHPNERKIFTIGSDFRSRGKKGYFSRFWGWGGRMSYLSLRRWDGHEILKNLKSKAKENAKRVLYDKGGHNTPETLLSIPGESRNQEQVEMKSAEIKEASGNIGKSKLFTNEYMAVKGESDRVHRENLKMEYMPNIPAKIVLIHIVMDSILPIGQRDTLKVLEQEMRDDKYNEKIVYLSSEDKASLEELIKELERVKLREEARCREKGYTAIFDVACDSKEVVGSIQDKYNIQAIAFKKAGEGDIVQIENIVLVLRALQTGSVEYMRKVYKFITGETLDLAINNISEFARNITFILTTAELDIDEIIRINALMEENIKSSA